MVGFCSVIVLLSFGQVDKLPEDAKKAIAAYEKTIEREKFSLIETLDKMRPATQGEDAALRTYVKSLQGGEKGQSPVVLKKRTSKLTRRKLGDTFDVFSDPKIKYDAAQLKDGVLIYKDGGQIGLSFLSIKNALVEFDYRLENSFIQTTLMVRHCYSGFDPKDMSYGAYQIQLGNGSGALSGRDTKKLSTIPPKNNAGEKLNQWNKMEIVMDGPEISVFINGKFVNKAEGLLDTAGKIALETAKGLELRNMKITMLE